MASETHSPFRFNSAISMSPLVPNSFHTKLSGGSSLLLQSKSRQAELKGIRIFGVAPFGDQAGHEPCV